MTTTEGKTMTLRELADAVERGEKIEFFDGVRWIAWEGYWWDHIRLFRFIKPVKKVRYLAYENTDGFLVRRREECCHSINAWKRRPAFDLECKVDDE